MRIILSMVGIALGIGIAIIAGVYGWEQYAATTPAAAPVNVPQSAPKPQKAEQPKPVSVPAEGPASTKPPSPLSATPPMAQHQTPSGIHSPVPGEDKPIAVPETPNLATPEKLAQLSIGMTEEDVQKTFGKAGVRTQEADLPAYTPEGWYELRWPNADGSYISALFNEQKTLVFAEPFNMPGAYEWLATPWYAIPNWLNTKLREGNMAVRLPAVEVVAAQTNTYQFSGLLVNAEGETLGLMTGTYYVNDPNGRYTRAIEGSYQYALPNGAVDSNTFQFSE